MLRRRPYASINWFRFKGSITEVKSQALRAAPGKILVCIVVKLIQQYNELIL